MRQPLVSASFLLFCALSACRRGDEQAGSATTITEAHAPVVSACPLGVPETRLTTMESADRVIVAFGTTPAHVDELRGRVAHQAALNGPGKHEGPGHEGRHGTGHEHGLRLWELPQVRTIIQETPDGASLHVMPLDPKDLPIVSRELRARVRRIADKGCPP